MSTVNVLGSEVTKLLGLQKKSVYRLIKNGELVPTHKAKELRSMRFNLEDVIKAQKAIEAARKEKIMPQAQSDAKPVTPPQAEQPPTPPPAPSKPEPITVETVTYREAAKILGISPSALGGYIYRTRTVKDYEKPLHVYKMVDKSPVLKKDDVLSFKEKWGFTSAPPPAPKKPVAKPKKRNNLLSWNDAAKITELPIAEVQTALKTKELYSLYENDIEEYMVTDAYAVRVARLKAPKVTDAPKKEKAVPSSYVLIHKRMDLPVEAVRMLVRVFGKDTSWPTIEPKSRDKLVVLESLWDGVDNPFTKLIDALDYGSDISVKA